MIALTRAPSPTIGECQLSHLEREAIDPERAKRQHGEYERVLEELGCDIVRVPPAADMPDSVFVEDTAVVVDEVAIIARPGAAARRPEVDAVAKTLAGFRPLRLIEPPGTLDGGDVLRVGKTLWVGVSGRTNGDGVAQMRGILEPLGYEVRTVPFRDCLHLKTAVTAVAADTLLVNPRWVEPDRFADLAVVEVDPVEPFAANVLRIGETVVMPAAHGRTRGRLTAMGVRVVEVDVSELAKAEGGVTCCSVLLSPAAPPDEARRNRPPGPGAPAGSPGPYRTPSR